jgi:RNA polymerase-binding transcription factor DksA
LRGNEQVPADQVADAATIDPGDSGDSSVDLQARDDTGDVLLDLRAQLNEVEHALSKFENGTYGICERCGRPIPLARLRILPETRYDVEYEEDVEAGKAPR